MRLRAAVLTLTAGDVRRELAEAAALRRRVDQLRRPTAHLHVLIRHVVQHLSSSDEDMYIVSQQKRNQFSLLRVFLVLIRN